MEVYKVRKAALNLLDLNPYSDLHYGDHEQEKTFITLRTEELPRVLHLALRYEQIMQYTEVEI